MNTRTTTIITFALLIAGVLASALAWNYLPDMVASHWNVNDQVDGYMPKFWGVFLVPLITLAMLLLFLVIPAIDPLKANIAKFRPVFNGFIVVIMAFMLFIHLLTLAWNLGYRGFKMSMAIMPLMGVLLIYAGYMMRTSKRNFFIGIRTPWTLSSDQVWEQTHKVGSVLFMVCGALAMVAMLFGGIAAFWLLLAPLLAATVFLVIYSYVLYQRETGK